MLPFTCLFFLLHIRNGPSKACERDAPPSILHVCSCAHVIAVDNQMPSLWAHGTTVRACKRTVSAVGTSCHKSLRHAGAPLTSTPLIVLLKRSSDDAFLSALCC